MATDISIKVTGDDVGAALRRLQSRFRNTTPMMRAIAETLQDSIEQALESEADPETGSPWPELARSTILKRIARGKWPGKMLQLSQGGLASSFSASAGPTYALAGSNKIYARIHHLGGQAGPGHRVTIPARPYAGLTPAHRLEVVAIITRHLLG